MLKGLTKDKWQKRFPFFLKIEESFDTTRYFSYREIECGSGWYDLIWGLCEQIEEELDKETADVRNKFAITQVKEKLGRLRINTYAANKAIDDLVTKAERKSLGICQRCGKPGKLRKGSYWSTLCDDCCQDSEK